MTDTAIGPTRDELDIAIARYRDHLHSAAVTDFDIGSLDRLGQAVRIAALRSPDGFTNDGFGYGATAAEALVGALGEMSETWHVHRALERAPACEVMSYTAMLERFGSDAVIDPLTLCLPAGSPYTPSSALRWVAVQAWPDGERVWAPRECVATSPFDYATTSSEVVARGTGEPLMLFRPITCGLGAGVSPAQAISHGVLELLQRDGNCTRFRAMDRGIDLMLDHVDDPGIRTIIESLRHQGIRVRAKLASTEFDLVNLYVIGEPSGEAAAGDFPLMMTACGEAVHANRERALRKALLEYTAARVRKTFMHGPLDPIRRLATELYEKEIMAYVDPDAEERRALEEMIRWLGMDTARLRALLDDTVFSSHESRAFSTLPSVPDSAVREPQSRLDDVAARLRSQDLSICYFDASPPGEEAPQVVKTIVPGLEGETLSYHRVGERGVRRLAAEYGELVSIGAPSAPDDRRIRLGQAAEARLGGPAWFGKGRADEIVGSLYPLYREPSSHTARARMASSPDTTSRQAARKAS